MVVFLGIGGILMLIFGLYARSGGAKWLFLTRGIPVLIPRAIQNMFIPFGITLIILEIIISDLVPTIELRQLLIIYVGGPALIITFILGVWNPRWLRPQWLNYLKDEYGPASQLLLAEARKNVPEWVERVKTQEGLEEWAEETYRALGFPPRFRKIKHQ